MDLKERLLQFLTALPEVDTPDRRKGLLALSGFAHLGVYLDWQGSNAAFFSHLLAAFGRHDKEALLQFLSEVQRQPHLEQEKQAIVAELRREVQGLGEEAWQRQFALAAPLEMVEGPPDPEMLATGVVSTVLTPYLKMGAEELRQQTGAHTVDLAARVWQRVQRAFAGDAEALDWLELYREMPEKIQSKLIPRLSRRIAADASLATDLARLLAGSDAADEAALRTLITVAQEVGTVTGELVGAVFGKDALPAGAGVTVQMKIDRVEGTAVGVVLGGDTPVTIGGQHTHGDRVEGDKVAGDKVEGDKVEGDKETANTGGGAYVAGDVDTDGGDFVGRDHHVGGDAE